MFVNGKLNGIGKQTSIGGIISEGEFKNGFLHGTGKRTHDGKIWEGEFKDDDLIKGKITKKNGDFEEGEFTGTLGIEKLNGKGKRVCDNTIHDGHWENGSFRGIGTSTLIRQGIVFEGNWVEGGCLQGHAKRTFPGECIEEGNFEVLKNNGEIISNEMHGKGMITFPDGTFLDGYFNWGVIKGKRTLPNGIVIEGDLRQGQLNGQGKMTYRNGHVDEGVFEFGRFLHK